MAPPSSGATMEDAERIMWQVDIDTLRRIARDLDKRLENFQSDNIEQVARMATLAQDIYDRRR